MDDGYRSMISFYKNMGIEPQLSSKLNIQSKAFPHVHDSSLSIIICSASIIAQGATLAYAVPAAVRPVPAALTKSPLNKPPAW